VKFSDGSTNWREVVPDVESGAEDLEGRAGELDSALEEAEEQASSED
jgi:hypothetical protein